MFSSHVVVWWQMGQATRMRPYGHRTGALERGKDVRMRSRPYRPRASARTTPRGRGWVETPADGGLPPQLAARRTTGRSVMATVPLVETRADPPDTSRPQPKTAAPGRQYSGRTGGKPLVLRPLLHSTRGPRVHARHLGRGDQNHHAANGDAIPSSASPPLRPMLPPPSRIWQTNPHVTSTSPGGAPVPFDRLPAL